MKKFVCTVCGDKSVMSTAFGDLTVHNNGNFVGITDS